MVRRSKWNWNRLNFYIFYFNSLKRRGGGVLWMTSWWYQGFLQAGCHFYFLRTAISWSIFSNYIWFKTINMIMVTLFQRIWHILVEKHNFIFITVILKDVGWHWERFLIIGCRVLLDESHQAMMPAETSSFVVKN